ncbi:MAG: DUF4118 domain-containing protein, partial [Chloroflexota bacterium]
MRTGRGFPDIDPRRIALVSAAAIGSVAAATVVVALLQSETVGIVDASPVYLVAVVLVGARYGSFGAVLAAVLGFLAYDLLFIAPSFSLAIADPQQVLDLALFLFV